jgi:hypothetical protein
MTEVIEKAKQRLAELEAEAEQLRTFIKVYVDLSGDKKLRVVSSGTQMGVDSEDYASPGEIVAGAIQLMKERGRPLSRSRLVKLLTENGLKLPGQDKSKNVGTVIWRSKRFDNIAGFGYWPKELGRWTGVAPPQGSLLVHPTDA